MPPLAAIERFFERLFERPSARLFRTRVQPVQIQRRIERAMESGSPADRGPDARPEPVRRPPPPGRPGRVRRHGRRRWPRSWPTRRCRSRGPIATRWPIGRGWTSWPIRPSQRADIRVDARFAEPAAGRSRARPRSLAVPSRPAVDDTCDPTATRRLHASRARRRRAPSCSVTDPDGRTREVVVGPAGPDDRSGRRQRPGRARRPRVAAPRPDRRAARHAGLSRTSAARTARRSTASRSPRSSSASATGSRSGTRRSSSRSPRQPD